MVFQTREKIIPMKESIIDRDRDAIERARITKAHYEETQDIKRLAFLLNHSDGRAYLNDLFTRGFIWNSQGCFDRNAMQLSYNCGVRDEANRLWLLLQKTRPEAIPTLIYERDHPDGSSNTK